ncbi:hypothetical protein [Methylobacterium mesophilicum]|uniref:hypothetical protein n=1 Tax=Methylobacterium mesophilicum TaxID=39956 RepID=UPI002F3544AC
MSRRIPMPLVRNTAFRAACLTVLAFGSAYAAPARAQSKPNVVVMGEDADEDAVPRGNRIFQRVIHELSETMNLRGYNVYDETAVAMGFTQANRVRRRDAELIEVARAVQTPPLDVVAVFQIYASASKSPYSDIVRPEIRIPGRLLNVRTGQSLGSFEVAGLQLPPLPQGCDRECLLERVGAEAKTVGADLAAALTAKLDGVRCRRRATRRRAGRRNRGSGARGRGLRGFAQRLRRPSERLLGPGGPGGRGVYGGLPLLRAPPTGARERRQHRVLVRDPL